MQSANGRFLLGLLLGVLVGGALVLLFAPDDAPPGEPTSAPTSSAGRDDDSQRHDEAKALRALADRERDRDPRESAGPDVSSRSYGTAVGTGAMEGRVLDREGGGVEGVALWLERLPDRDAVDSAATLEAAMRSGASAFHRHRASQRETTSDATGAFRFDALPEGCWSLSGSSDGWRVTPEPEGPVWTGARVLLVATRVARVPVTVVAEDGTIATRATIEVGRRPSDSVALGWTPEEPTVELTEGRHELRALSDEADAGIPSGASEWHAIVVDTDVPPPELRLVLRDRVGIRGEVLVPDDGLRVDRIRVQAVAVAPGQVLDDEHFLGTDHMVRVRPGEPFAFLDLDPGTWALGASRGRFLFPFRDEAGAYLVRLEEEEEVEAYYGAASDAVFTLELGHADHGERAFRIERGTSEHTVRFEAAATLTATIVGYAGSGYEGRLRLGISGADEARFTTLWNHDPGELSPEGAQTFEGLQPGRYRVVLSARPKNVARPAFWHWANQAEVDVAPGANHVELRVPPLHALRVVWPDGEPGAELQMRAYTTEIRTRLGRVTARLGEDGVAEFGALVPGDYLLDAGAVGGMRVTVPSGEVVFAPEEPSALHVVITDPTGDFARLGLRSGDRIVAVHGEPFRPEMESGILRDLGRAKRATVEWLVERDGATFPLTIRSEDLGGWRERGARFVPDVR